MNPFANILYSAKGIFDKAKEIASKMLENYGIPSIPDDDPSNKTKLEGYLDQLYKDSKEWRKVQAVDRARNTYNDIVSFWRDERQLVNGNHWRVWNPPSGRKSKGNEWKNELQDSEISNQIRTKVEYIAGNWHELTVNPNIDFISQILDKERGDEWSSEIRASVWKAKIEGTAHFKTCLEYDEQGNPIFRERLLDNENFFPTPYSTGIERQQNCWYAIYARMRFIQDVIKEFPDIDPRDISISQSKMNDITLSNTNSTNHSYENTKMVDDMRYYLDDDTLVDAPVDEEAITLGIEMLSKNESPQIDPQSNHLAFIQAYYQLLEAVQGNMDEHASNTLDEQNIDPVAEQLINRATLIEVQMKKHYEELEKLQSQNVPIGKLKKYPFGRYVCTISGKVIDDRPNPYEIEWRYLFHKYDNEKVAGSYYGRSDVEILWDVNKSLDTNKSYVADIALAVGFPKMFVNETEKKNIPTYNNNFLEPAIYTGQPPVFRQGHAPDELMQLYSVDKQEAASRLGVNQVVKGQEPSAGSSAKLVQTLLTQSLPQVAGECNANLSVCIERMMKTRLLLMKKFYKMPRIYYIDNRFQVVNVSRLLTVQKVKQEDGQEIEQEIPTLEISVKPNSNFPNQFESELGFIVDAYNTLKYPDGSPMVPPQAIYDVLSQRFPQFGEGGNWRTESEIFKMGWEMFMQQQQQLQMQQKATKQVTMEAQKQQMKTQSMNGQAVSAQ